MTGITKDGKEKFYDAVNLDIIKEGEPYPPGSEEFRDDREMGSDSPDGIVPQEEVSVNRDIIPQSADINVGESATPHPSPLVTPSPQGEGLNGTLGMPSPEALNVVP